MHSDSRPVVAVALPKGGMGRTTTVYLLGAELARLGYHVRLEDLDPARHLSAVVRALPFPDGLPICLADTQVQPFASDDLVLLDCAPEASERAMVPILRRASHVLVPIKGPESGAISALPLLLGWLDALSQPQPCRVLGLLPTMYKPRRAESAAYLAQLERVAAQRSTRVFAPIHDLAPVAQWRLPSPPYAALAREVVASHALRPQPSA